MTSADVDRDGRSITAAEGVAVDAAGNVYGAVIVTPGLKKYVRR